MTTTNDPYVARVEAAIEECNRHIEELTAWLDSHTPRPHWTSSQHQACEDRRQSRNQWRAKLARLFDEIY